MLTKPAIQKYYSRNISLFQLKITVFYFIMFFILLYNTAEFSVAIITPVFSVTLNGNFDTFFPGLFDE